MQGTMQKDDGVKATLVKEATQEDLHGKMMGVETTHKPDIARIILKTTIQKHHGIRTVGGIPLYLHLHSKKNVAIQTSNFQNGSIDATQKADGQKSTMRIATTNRNQSEEEKVRILRRQRTV